jgi:hypothetical protein
MANQQNFDLKLPVSVCRYDRKKVEITGRTRSLSVCAVVMEAGLRASRGRSIEYVVALPGTALRCWGRISRCRRDVSGDFKITATLERYQFIRESRNQSEDQRLDSEELRWCNIPSGN